MSGELSKEMLGECLEGMSGKLYGDVQTPMQVYKSLRAAVMICDTVVNTQIHRETAFDWLLQL